MSEKITVHLELSADGPNFVSFGDTHAGLSQVWYRFAADAAGNVELSATPDGFEHLARYFLKLARGRKESGYHAHHALEFGGDQYADGRELTIGVVEIPADVA